MATSAEQIQVFLQRARPWTTAALILAVVLGAYYLFLGFRFWSAAQDVSALSEQIEQSGGGGFVIPDTDAQDSLRATGERQLAEQSYWYSYSESEDLLGKIASVAEATRVDLISVTGGERQKQMVGSVQLEGQPMTISIQGNEPEDVYRFISRLSETPPVTAITDIQLTDLEADTVAEIKLLFFLLSPTPAVAAGEG